MHIFISEDWCLSPRLKPETTRSDMPWVKTLEMGTQRGS
jgi:hypothetical protein